jgi:hypothetical protein
LNLSGVLGGALSVLRDVALEARLGLLLLPPWRRLHDILRHLVVQNVLLQNRSQSKRSK